MVYGKGSSRLLQEAPTIPSLFRAMTAPLNVGYLYTIRSIAALAAISGGCPLRIYETKIVTRNEQLSKHRKLNGDAFVPIKAFYFMLLPHSKPLEIKRL